jgi:hypothetical protein
VSDPLLDTLAGNYRLVAKLGAGGMGDVYKAVHTTIGSKVAIKVLHATSDPDSEERFLREAKAVNLIEHDGVVKVLDAGRLASGRPFLVMELLDGAALSELQRANTLSPVDACLVMVDVLDALSAAHAASVIHRDLKPANIFRTRSGRTVVLDFGIAKLIAADGPARLTMSGSAIGTPAYMAPEQIGDRDVGPAADLYAAGVVLFELLCGRLPFDGGTVDILNGHLERSPPPPRALRPALSVALSDLLLRALEKDPAKRFSSAATMRDALRIAMTGALASAPRPGSAPVITEHVSDATVDLARGIAPTAAHTARESGPPTVPQRPGSSPARDVGPPAVVRPANRRSRTPIVVAAIGIVALGIVIAVIATKRGGSATRDAGVAIGESRDAAGLQPIGPGSSSDAAGSDTLDALDPLVVDAAVPQRPADELARDAAMRLPSLRNRQVSPCLAEDRVGQGLADPLQLALARYRNALACKHVGSLDDAATRAIAQAQDLAQNGDLALATRLVDRQLAGLAALQIDRAFVERRVATVRALQRDDRVPEPARDRMSELIRDALAEIAAGRFESANIALDEAAAVAWKSIRLRGG